MVKILFILLLSLSSSFAQSFDPNDPFSFSDEAPTPEANDEDKSVEQLIQEAVFLEMDGKLIDSRTKLLSALKKDPESVLVLTLLSDYYYRHVGHFRLCLKYVKKALELFEKQNGKGPYVGLALQKNHSDLLKRLSEARLSLDNYEGALETLNEYEQQGYPALDIASSKAWILMKLNKLDEAIAIAKSGLQDSFDPGRTLNVLGILLSMTGRREEAIKIFEQAYRNELSMGSIGSPATPLNNAGEVFREDFQEDRAKRAWLKATSLPDGCEHVLPSLNLAILNLDSADYESAKITIDNFESCVAKYPLRNGEEHRALVNLARGRIAMYTGDQEEAIKQFDGALKRTQWLGKIGTSSDDLKSAIYLSFAQALTFKINELKQRLNESALQWFAIQKTLAADSIKAWWYRRKGLQILSTSSNYFEDLYPRHSDSMLDYATLGMATAAIPNRIFRNKIKLEQSKDNREIAKLYYQSYLAENELRSNSSALNKMQELIKECRPEADLGLKIHLDSILLKHLKFDDKYTALAEWIYEKAPAAISNYSNKLPVNYSGFNDDLRKLINDTGFYLDNSQTHKFKLVYKQAKEHSLQLVNSSSSILQQTEDQNLEAAINRLNEQVFKQEF